MDTKQVKSAGIVRISPHILKRGQFWFEKNEGKIKSEAKKITSWWNSNYRSIQVDEKFPLGAMLRQLDDWGYIKTSFVKSPGEFASRGGIVDVFPVNLKNAVRFEYFGDLITSISVLENVLNKNPQEELRKIIYRYPESAKSGKAENKIPANFKIGTFVVHIDHGIARFAGMEKEELMVLEYAKGDRLLVPISVSEKVSPYLGFGEPKLTRLGGNIWEKTKRKVKEDLVKTAKHLAKIYAKREMTLRPAYNPDIDVAGIGAETFEYMETPGQIQAIEDIKKDFSRTRPMDRIICGDVGFGKTEVAIRAASYAVGAGYQVAIITPTTVLAHQHFKTFQKRLEQSSYPLNVEKLTRIEKPAEQKTIKEDIKNNKCDIVIGTHRLLQKDIEFNRLGLLIIDEEQKFGVKQKEFFKEKRSELDVLSLSATPIPRTLYFALNGIRDLSIISTPPVGKRPIKTFVRPKSKKIIKQAIEKELGRNGQIYYLHNRIGSMPLAAENLKQLVPSAKIEYLHAKMPEEKIIEIMDKFESGKIDVLMATTIMENGLDFQNANTLIVENATGLGLAQAHQIRGRIGRKNKQAYAYFLYPGKKMKGKAKKRMLALEEADYLGAGYEVAMKDLEIRGAGNLLGREQSGNIAKVGFNLYCQMLAEALEELRSA
ncbi:MAG: DEAD/DEAH box helicase [Candidatus Spechtbacterales bacterium]